jgi:hypothetical protein
LEEDKTRICTCPGIDRRAEVDPESVDPELNKVNKEIGCKAEPEPQP